MHDSASETIDAHTAGEPLRLIVSGFPPVKGKTILEQREYVRKNHDRLRRALMLEPRGHADMYGALLTPPEHEGSQAGVLFMHNEGYSTMCGHGVIAVTKIALERNLIVVPREPDGSFRLTLDSPAGPDPRDGADGGRLASPASPSAMCRPSCCTHRCRCAPARGTSTWTWPSAARSMRSWTAKQSAFRSFLSGSRTSVESGWKSSTRSKRQSRSSIRSSHSCAGSTERSSPDSHRTRAPTCGTSRSSRTPKSIAHPAAPAPAP